MARYVMHPGDIPSKTDGDWHFISMGQLMSLYRVPRDARVVDARHPAYREQPGDIHCRPRYHGDYPVFAE